MGNFSRDTFDRLKHYVGVRLQQGVPVVDADWNEMEDIRRYEVRAFLKWFVGEGVPAENDGFRILPAAGDNDFQIQGGDGSPDGEGRCLVDGWDVINESTINYTAQALYDNAALAAAWGVDPLPPLTTPAADRSDTVYLDVWEREVDSSEDYEHLVNSDIGIETCVRRKREWVVRVAENAASKPPAPANHAHLELAGLARGGGAAAIQAADITDLRVIDLKMISLKDVQQIVADAFGTPYSLDHDGQPNLKVSLRDAINAILRGSLPSTPTLPLTTEGELNAGFSAFQDAAGDIWAFWMFSPISPPEILEIRHRRFSPASGTWDAPVTATTNASLQGLPAVVEDRNSDLWLFWTVEQNNDDVIFYNRYLRSSGSWQSDRTLAETTGFNNREPVAVADRAGDIWAFWTSNRNGPDLIYYSRFRRASGDWEPEELLSKSQGGDRRPFALEDSTGDIWLFWESRSDAAGFGDIWCKRYNRQSDSWDEENQQITTDVGEDENVFALEDNTGDIWVLWVSDRSGSQNIWYKRYIRASDSWEAQDSQLTTDSQFDVEDFFAFEDSSGDIWVIWYTTTRTNSQIFYKRYSREGGWGLAVALATGAENDLYPFALEDAAGDVWVFWTQTPPFTGDFETLYSGWNVVYRKLIPAI